jgi:predicted PurR-regulated permease PerM
MAGGLAILALLFYLIANDLYSQISSISTNLESSPKHINDWVHHLKTIHPGFGNRLDEFDIAKVATNALPSISAIMDNALNGFATITWLVVMFFLILYMLVDGADHLKAIRALLPKNIRLDATNLFNDIAKAHRGWALASICNIASATILTSVGLSLIGIPGALLLGFFAGLGELIPNIGPLICSAPVLLLILVAQPEKFLPVLGMFVVVWTIQGYGISPLMMKFSIKLPVLVTIIAVLVFGTLFGFLGILVAIPLVADLVVLWSFQSARREKDTTDYDTVNLSPEARHSIFPDAAHSSRLQKLFRRQRPANPPDPPPSNSAGMERLERAEARANK